MLTPEEADLRAVGIYAVMQRDPSDAIDMISECDNARTLDTLYKMLMSEGTERTDRDLNALFVSPVARRRAELDKATTQLKKDL